MVSKLRIIANTPAEWLMAFVENIIGQYYDGDSFAKLLLDPSKQHYRLTCFQEIINQFELEPPLLGPKAKAFLNNAPEYCDKWIAPFSVEKVETIAYSLKELDEDLLADPTWLKFKGLLEEAKHILGKKQENIVSKALDEFLAGYRYFVIHRSFFHTKALNESKELFALNDLHFKEIIYLINQTLITTSENKLYAQLQDHCKQMLEEEVNELLEFSNEKCNQGLNLMHVSYHLKTQIPIIKSLPQFEFLSEEIRTPIIDKAYTYLERVMNVMERINLILLALCEQAKLGVFMGNLVSQQVKNLLEESVFKDFIELGAIAVARYINSPETIHWIHQSVIAVRVNEVKKIILDSDEDFIFLGRELRKATHYRVRRNIIEVLFNQILDGTIFIGAPSSWGSNYITAEQEHLLRFLQEEYLHALRFQAEKMKYEQRKAFLERFEAHPIFRPLPRVSAFAKKNADAKNELKITILEIEQSKQDSYTPTEGPALDDLDCPIEQDIMGALTQKLTDIIFHKDQNQKNFNQVVEILERTFEILTDPCFEIQKSLEDYAINKEYSSLIEGLEEEKNVLMRLERILEIYDHIEEKEKTTQKITPSRAKLSFYRQHKTIKLLQELYIDGLQHLINNEHHETDHEIQSIYERVIIPSLDADLFNNSDLPQVSKKARNKIEKMSEALISGI